MPYFSAVLAADGRSWRARDVDVTDAGSLEDLADQLRSAAVGDHPVLAVLEREDEWFALVRVDGDADPRVFVSDMAAAERSRYGDLLAVAAEVDNAGVPLSAGGAPAGAAQSPAQADDPADEPADDPALVVGDVVAPAAAAASDAAEDATDDDADLLGSLAADLEQAAADPAGLAAWAGETDLLDDLGLATGTLLTLVEDHVDDPAAVLGEIGEACGFDDLLEALR